MCKVEERKKSKLDWSKHASIRAPASVVKQLDEYKHKHGYTSRPQAIISAIEKVEKIDLVEEMKLTDGKLIRLKKEMLLLEHRIKKLEKISKRN